jgi:AraC family transcriptional activator of pobA
LLGKIGWIESSNYSIIKTFLYFYHMRKLPIYSLNEFPTSSKDFYTNDLSTHLATHRFIHTTHKHDFYLCALFVNGSGRHVIDFETYDIQPGTVFFLNPGQFHNWKFEEKPEGFIFFHSKEFYDLNYQHRQIQDFPFYFSGYNSPILHLEDDKLNEFIPLFKSLQVEIQTQKTFSSAKLVTLVDLIYINLSRIYLTDVIKETVQSKSILKLRQFEKLIESNFKEIKTPSAYSDLMNITTKHLNRIVKLSINKTASELIANRIVLEAKRLLIHSDNRVMEVADQLGFNDYSYFNRFFKKHTSLTPLEFFRLENNH